MLCSITVQGVSRRHLQYESRGVGTNISEGDFKRQLDNRGQSASGTFGVSVAREDRRRINYN